MWKQILADFELNPLERHMLEHACYQADLVDRLEAELEGAALVVRGSLGQPAPSPLVSEIRLHRTVLATLLKALKLSDEPAGSGRRSWDRSVAARKAARARWGTPVR